ncbi:site-specific DNA-methyltransferase [Rodentibacter caecimuris]|uniref:site-specific DNA-methyltransferase n=1 Tax=Rodentibacter caecimuris TaxID=1796644 RepID=UPI000986698B|nr:type III restriction endonuclease subunit M [Rodentibacter heylii]
MITETVFTYNDVTSNSLQLIQLKKLFPNCFDESCRFLIDKFQTEIAEKTDISHEFYEMNWLGKSYAKLLRNLPPETLLCEDRIHNAKPENANSQNLLIQGDNLEVLKHLKNAYTGRVKMIYIDPPYNTGSDGFVYQDDRKFTPEQLSELAHISFDEAERILKFTAKGSNSHSAWLTFMYPRLYIARDLLKEDGVIFISIDDNEVAQLKLLCDEVFGEGNFVAQCIHKNNSNKNQSKFIGVSTEYIFIYAKNLLDLSNSIDGWKVKKEGTKDIAQKFKQLINQGLSLEEIHSEIKDMYKRPKYAHLSRWNKIDEKGIFKDADLSRQGGRKDYSIINPDTGKMCLVPERGWGKSYEELLKLQKEGLIWYGDENTPPSVKSYITENDYSVADNFWYFDNSIDTKFIKRAFGTLVFENPKPLEMLKRVIEIIADKKAIILDFFGGSGTTAHAMMQLNAEDNGNRQFILVQLAEKTDEKSEAFKAGYKTIFDITKARIEKSAVKIRQDFPDTQCDLGFKIYQTTNNFRHHSDDEFSLEQATLPFVENLTEAQYHSLLTTWALNDGALLTDPISEVKLGDYTAHLCDKRLYLLETGFTSADLLAFIQKLDSDKDFNPNRVIVLGENMSSAMQQELNQAIETYSNKKNIALSLIIRN